ncbi:ketopantoate reductase family protein [Hippea alviniae]|uniref:ketopantoate reductase family protein n=1 Tax=Hippea alviniae TaxID=1279027 RepID=UPI0003B646F9|nr:ketopantoate reductase family protein [Hippea alviniae]
MRVVIFGAGALGLWFGFMLDNVADVVCISRERIKNTLKNNTLVLKKGDELKSKKLKIETSINSVGKPDFVLLATKSYDSEEALKTIKSKWNSVDIITIQNGIYTEEVAEKLFGKDKIFPASVLIGSRFINESTIEEFLNEGMKIGSLIENNRLDKICNVFENAGIKIEKSGNIMRDKWHKFMFYCSSATLNALTGILDLSFEHARWIVRESLNEIVRVAEYLNLDFSAKEVADDVFGFSQSFKPKKWKASVGEDLRKGRKTEIEYLNGYVVKLAKKFNLEVKVNETLYRVVKMLEFTGLFKGLTV